MRKITIAIVLLLAAQAVAQIPPSQPESGPAGKLYFHEKVRVAGPFQPPLHKGDPWYNYFIYFPDVPRPASAPVVLFIPGYGAWSPDQYQAWIHHMVKMGYTVVWARADQSIFAVWQYMADAEAAWNDALWQLAVNPFLVRPKRVDGRIATAMVGHSIGGWIVPAMASRAGKGRTLYPPPKAVVSITPGQGFLPKLDFSGILSDTKLVITVGDRDSVACAGSAQKLWAGTGHIPDGNRDVLLVQSDPREIPSDFGLRAHHMYPTGLEAIGGIDNMDFHGLWKLSVGALNCGFYGEDCSYALGNGSPEQVETGMWSDGRPFEPLLWLPAPDVIPAIPGCPN